MDRYTKTVLTVIAGCLLVLVGNQIDFPSKAHAAQTSASMLEVSADGVAYYHNGVNLFGCMFPVGGCKKLR